MSQVKTITVYAASSFKLDNEYLKVAREIGKLIAEKNITLVYSGGPNGLMGAAANAALDGGGNVTGVIPQFMIDRGWLNTRLTDLIVTDDMHSRKQIMADRSDGCVALPGGIGTLEELLEIITWRQLGLYNKPIVILNTNGFYDFLLAQLKKIEDENFMRHETGSIWSVATTPEEAVEQIIEQSRTPILPLE